MTGPNQKVLGWNRQSYQRLKRALSLNLRRQIFLAVCDDLTLRNRLAARLHAELAYPDSSHPGQQSGDRELQDYPQLVTLNLNLNDPNLLAQVGQWLTRHPVPQRVDLEIQPPSFQILGIERLTRQSAAVQRLFLTYLQGCERHLPTLDASLLLWVPQPWFRAIQQSAPEFWDWRTGVFEFVGDPTPLGTATKPTVLKPVPRSKPTAIAKPTEEPASPPPNLTPVPASKTDATPEPAISLRDLLTQELTEFGDLDPEALIDTLAGEVFSAADAPEDDAVEPWSVEDSSPTGSHAATIPPFLSARSGFSTPFSGMGGSAPPEETLEASAESDLPNSLVVAGDASGSREPAVVQEATLSVTEAEVTHELASANPQALSSVPSDLVNLIVTTALVRAGVGDRVQSLLPVRSLTQLLEQLPSPLVATLEAEPALRMLQHLEQLHQQQASSTAIAATYRTLGNAYRDRLEQGQSSPELLAIAIQAYEQALEHLDDASPLGPDILNDLGNLYWMLSRLPPQPEQQLPYLEQGIAAYHLALNHINPEQQPQSYAMIQNNLGAAYADLARYQTPAEHLQRSIVAYQEALRYRTPEAEPLKYASTQNNLGTAHWHLAQHQQPAVHLKQAIIAYTEALGYYNPEQDSLAYAMIQNNLGTAYWNLAQYEQPREFLTLAISSYRIALMYRTVEVNPAAYAATQNNLGTAYWHLASRAKEQPEQRHEALHSAIAAYEAALTTVQDLAQHSSNGMPKLSFDVSATHNNLGLAHYQLATDSQNPLAVSERSTHLEAALQGHLTALNGWQQQPELARNALSYVVQTVKAFYSECGLSGQNLALSRLPGHLLPEILPRL